MIYSKDSYEYEINVFALQEMEECVPMTIKERQVVRTWVSKGHELESNPWHYADSDGYELNYLQAYRIHYGYCSGPWDYWKGSDSNPLWDERDNCFRTKDERF